jgi:predicted AlkP superfamily pyrophosphatase or phosphodiesterase
MKCFVHRTAILTIAISLSICFVHAKTQKPSVVVFFVVDQGAFHYFAKVKPFFSGGFKTLFNRGMCYNNAYHPHGSPATAQGHATISTGTVAFGHGVALNEWVDEVGNLCAFGDAPEKSAPIIGTQQSRNQSLSSCLLEAETLSDRLIKENPKNKVFALSSKGRAAIALAGQKGKALWFDTHEGVYISSKAYFEELPEWVEAFNKENNPLQQKSITWTPCFASGHPAYHFPNINNYQYAAYSKPLINSTQLIKAKASNKDQSDIDDSIENDNGLSFFVRTPHANQHLLDLAKTCLDNEYTNAKENVLFLWISISSLDKVGHEFGPESKEAIDTIYHLDKQLDSFIRYCKTKIGPKNVLFVLTADHGISPIPELMQQKGYTSAQRISGPDLVEKMNETAEKKFGVKNAIMAFKSNQFFLNRDIDLPKKTMTKLLRTLKAVLSAHPGIKKVWTKNELSNTFYDPNKIEKFFTNQLYTPRSGDLICMPKPYCAVTKYTTGAAHRTPYEPDTHVPLILYQEGVLKHKTFSRKVWVPQVTTTLAHVLHIQQPEKTQYAILPGF